MRNSISSPVPREKEVLDTSVEFLAEDLKKLVGWGAQAKTLALLPNLRAFAGFPPEPMDLRREGLVIRRRLIEAIDNLTGSFEFYGRLIPAEKMRRAYKVLFKIEGTGQGHETRRGRAIVVLGSHCSVRSWRDEDGREWHLMLLLAQEMLPNSRQISA
jgi:hypothetical protein